MLLRVSFHFCYFPFPFVCFCLFPFLLFIFLLILFSFLFPLFPFCFNGLPSPLHPDWVSCGALAIACYATPGILLFVLFPFVYFHFPFAYKFVCSMRRGTHWTNTIARRVSFCFCFAFVYFPFAFVVIGYLFIPIGSRVARSIVCDAVRDIFLLLFIFLLV